jgi:hypothetical protein
VAKDSINGVLLDEDYETQCSTLVVAAHMADSTEDQAKVTLRNTTMFPKIKGIVSLCLLCFAPQVELRYCGCTNFKLVI